MINFLEQFFNSITQLKGTNSSTNLLNKRGSKQKRLILILETSRLKKQIKVTALLLMTKILHSIRQLGRTITNFFLFGRRQLFNTRNLSTIQTSTRTQIILLGTFGLGLSFGIIDLSILQTFHTIAKSLNGKTVGVSLSGLSKIILFTRPKFSDTGITLGRILNGFNLGELGINLIDLSFETLRKGVGLSGRTNEIEERISILDRLSFGQSLQTSSIR